MFLPLFFLASLGVMVWTIASSLWSLAEGNTKSVLTKVIKTQLEEKAKAEAERSSSAESESAESALVEPATEEPEEAGAVHGWRLRGIVYDLTTLKPLSGCKMTFTDSVARGQEHCVTDARGRYRITLPALSGRGYQVAIVKPGYARNYLNPATEDVSEMAEHSRAELARDLLKTAGEPASLQPYDEKPFITDFHLAPSR